MAPSVLTQLVIWLTVIGLSKSQEGLSPHIENLADGKRITATATCGEDVDEPEQYCNLVGVDPQKLSQTNETYVIKGQLCSICDPTSLNEDLHHPAEFANNGDNRWWQSPPISRGKSYNKVNLTIDLGQLYQVAYVIIKMGNSPRPGIWSLERSVDNGKTYTAWQYFAGNEGDCELYFGADTLKVIEKDDDVVCTTRFSKVVPLEGGEIFVSLLNERPSAKTFFNSSVLQEFTQATNIRIRLLRTKTLLGHLMSVARQDPTVTRRYFYSIKDISVGGRCVCNGHANVCDIPDKYDRYLRHCRCQHKACGSRCEECCPGFIQKRWRPASYADEFVCEPCNCHGHSRECIFDEKIELERRSLDIYGRYEGGGVCQNCRHNTAGINCDKCIDTFYKPFHRQLIDPNVCQPCKCSGHYYTGNCSQGNGRCECKVEFLPPSCNECNYGYYDYPNCKACDCHKEGTVGGICEVGGGQCPCKENFIGMNCYECAPGYYKFPECIPCNCGTQGSLNLICDADSGQCPCLNNYGGQYCDRCEHGYFDYSDNCTFCSCDARGTIEEICDKEDGHCLCVTGFSGKRCDSSAPGFWGYPLAQICDCHERGSSSTICDTSGKCACLNGYSERTCDQCSPGYFNFPDCQPCNCDQSGSIGASCDSVGVCSCHHNFDGTHCDRCRDKFYNFPRCEECNCHPAGVLETFAGCGNAPVGELCECKDRVTGRICNKCRPLYWNLNKVNSLGCQDCNCNTEGTMGALATCAMDDGQCACKSHVTSEKCNECVDGTFNLMEDNIFGCSDCQCNIGGSLNNNCDKETGQCLCAYLIEGQRCDRPMSLHFFPTLFQEKHECENGKTPQNTPVRFGYDENIFPGYSWKGYAVYSELQKETRHEVEIKKPSAYRLIFHYMNPSNQPLKVKIIMVSDNPLADKQEAEITFNPTNGPELYTAVSSLKGFHETFVLTFGFWTLSIQSSHQDLFIDYFVFLPMAYYEAAILSDVITSSCYAKQSETPCLHHAYPDISDHKFVYGSAGYIDKNGTRESVELFENEEVLNYLNSPPMAWLSANQNELQFNVRLSKIGPYVIVLNYFTPDGSKATNIQVTTNTPSDRQGGRAVFYDCPYSWICRQVVQNFRGEVGVFNFDSNYVNIVLSSQVSPGADMTIHSIVLIPYEMWDMNHVILRPVCTRIGSNCIESHYQHSPETAKIEFENNFLNKSSSGHPPGVDNSTILVYLNATDKVVEIGGALRAAGRYKFVVHYFQPKYTDFQMGSLLQNGVYYEGTLPVPFCPSTAGCRTTLRHLNGTDVFQILENYVLMLRLIEDQEVWLDYLLVVPEASYSDNILNPLPRDKTKEFLEQCGKNHFNIDPSQTGLCQESVFALTSNYNTGALKCQCHYEGSKTFECQAFGGQCACRSNVIGRDCSQCKTGYFGFPHCRPCDCPSTALCDQVSGECICPPRVIGEKCERCALQTYGFDPIIGCEECRCSAIGVTNNDLQCNLNNGQCSCKDNIVGKRCDRCVDGYWSFPLCQLCNCDVRGTEEDICSQSDATCYCKTNTRGRLCDECQRGSYHLEDLNPDGCTECFCFGKAHVCSPSYLTWQLVTNHHEWKAAILQYTETHAYVTEVSERPIDYPDLWLMNLTSYAKPKESGYAYYSAPQSYLGSKITAYGSRINFTILVISSTRDIQPTREADFVLTGNRIVALHHYESIVENVRSMNVDIELKERNFRTLSGEPMKREQFMVMLNNLDGMYVRAQYDSHAQEARLSHFTMFTAAQDPSGGNINRAMSVESCRCSSNYKGSSCEDCAEGYYRTDTGPFGGFCIPCQCNNHADTCDPVTGICKDCKDNAIGDYCEECVAGYFGNALQGTPHDCLMCSCPLPVETNNFATSCTLSFVGTNLCECKTGYSGQTCKTCSTGYYGKPSDIGDFCRPCDCSTNIDTSSLDGCDHLSGRCLNCLNNSTGDKCEKCSVGFYGDAVLLKNCQECSCNNCGTFECNHYTGICDCHDSVIGDNCDRCAPEFWGFASCKGCLHCNCDEASENRQCDEDTGQCECKPGVTGRSCDRCKPGYWQYTEFGCEECACRAGFSVGVGCDPETGHCSCLPGVIGDNCESCPNRWVLVEGQGCKECDDCVHDLLETTVELSNLLIPVLDEYESAAQSFFLHKRLQVINESIVKLQPRVDSFDLSEEDLRPANTDIDILFIEAIAVSSRAKSLDDRATKSASDGRAVRNQTIEVLGSIEDGHNLARKVVDEVNFLVIGIETGRESQIEITIQEAERIVAEMKKINFTDENDHVRADLEISDEFLERVRNYSLSGDANKERVDKSIDRLIVLEKKINEMHKYISESKDKSTNVKNMNSKARMYGLENLKRKYSQIEDLSGSTGMLLLGASNYTNLAANKLGEAEQHYFILDSQLSKMTDAHEKLNKSVFDHTKQLTDASEPSQEAINHARDLHDRANELDNMLADTRQVTENALKAANANRNIVSAVEDASSAAVSAKNASNLALDLSSGMSESALKSVGSSQMIDVEASTKVNLVEDNLKPNLKMAQESVSSLKSMNKFANDNLDTIDRKMESYEDISLREQLVDLNNEATEIADKALQSNNKVTELSAKLDKSAGVARKINDNNVFAKRNTKLALEQVEKFEKKLPDMERTTNRLLKKKESITHSLENMGDRLRRLRRNITRTRGMTNMIKVGIDFEQGSALELKNPEDLKDTATSTELSVMIKTKDDSGLSLFLGTPVGGSNKIHRTTTDDFMALEIVNGYMRLTINLGAGAHSIINKQYVADNRWYKIYIKRIGKVVQLSVSYEDEYYNENITTVEEVLPGAFSILNLDPKVSKIFVGGIPTGVKVDPSLISTYYTGQMEDLWLNRKDIGLWNFVNRGSTDYTINGAKERLVLKETKTAHTMSFGSGYMIVSTKGHSTSPSLSVGFSFKTYAEDGLLFLIQNGKDEYMSLEMRGGKVRYQQSFRGVTLNLLTDGLYNDYEWHTIDLSRFHGDAIMKIDGTDAQIKKSTIGEIDFTTMPTVMYLGGYRGPPINSDVTNIDFRGCIQDMKVSEVTVDFSRSLESVRTVSGCKLETVGLVSFHSNSPGYIKLPSAEGSGLQLVFKFKTDYSNGLLFYTETKNRNNHLSLSLVNGALVLRSAPGGELPTGQYTKYNDSQWHIVIATRESNKLRLDIDDFEKFSKDMAQEDIQFDGPVYFSGVPRNHHISSSAKAGGTHFIGCIGDATLNGKIIDFSISPKDERPGSLLETCALSKYSDTSYETVTADEMAVTPKSKAGPTRSPPKSTASTFEQSTIETTTKQLDSCVLPVQPMKDLDVRPEDGQRFGSKRDSRIEFQKLPGVLRGEFSLSVDFRTVASEGIIFYAANINHRDFVCIYMTDGKIVFSFSPGNSPAIMRSARKYNNNQWHKLVVHRVGYLGRLEIDGFIVANGTSDGDSKHIEEQAPYYFGGLSSDIVELAKDNTEQTLLSFNGCLKGFRMHNKLIGGKRRIYAVRECSNKVESGVFFGSNSERNLAHAVVRLKFNVGLRFDMTLDIKPRTTNGVIMSVHGRRDFILLQIKDGLLELKVDNGKGTVKATYNFDNKFQICDGQWHSIQVLKNKHLLVLTVDGTSIGPIRGSLGASSAETNNPLFLGSQPRLSKRRGNAVTEKYVGCIRNVWVNNEKIDLAYTLFIGNVNAGSCPVI